MDWMAGIWRAWSRVCFWLHAVFCLLLAIPSAAGAAAPSAVAAADSAKSVRDREIEVLQQEIDHLEGFWSLVLLPMSILVGLLIAGGIIGIMTSLRYERRQTQLHDESRSRANEIHALTVSGESAAQERSAESHLRFLEDSHQTLTLVNETLALSKAASERAEEAIQEKASERLNEIDRGAKEVLAEALDKGQFKAVVRDPVIEERLKDIAHRIVRIEGLAGAHGLGLTAHCLFAEGLDRHLHSVPVAAIESWQGAAKKADDPDLRALALYWVGYERNNIGEFQGAARAFRDAREKHLTDKERPQHFELHRIEIQSRFFEMAARSAATADRRQMAQEFIGDLEDLVSALKTVKRMGFDDERRHCEETIGELLLWCARLSPLERPSFEPLTDSDRVSLEEAVDHFKQAGNQVWARFGKAQALWKLGEQLDDKEYRDLLDTLLAAAGSHREPRTLALRHAAILILEGEHCDGEEALDQAYRDLWHDLHHIGGRLTVFSPWQKRNIPLEQFRDEVKSYRRDCKQGG